MRKYIFIISTFILLPPIFIYGWFAATTGEHHYKRTNIFYFWLYTPEILKHAPIISDNTVYNYYYDIDNQNKYVTIQWSGIHNLSEKRKMLINYIQQIEGVKKYDCLWIYNNKNNDADNYQRYCVFQQDESLELEFFEPSSG